MSKVDEKTQQESSAAGAGGATASKVNAKPKESIRDTVESILFAFVLAFLFRTFEAEAFVIPTGSMAPTLYGRHKESTCTSCGAHIVVGASHEVIGDVGYLAPNSRLRGAVCSNCGFENDQLFNELAFNGDRILVNKYPYEFGDPSRWDVFVFKYPAEPQTNYIKRLVGLPNETIRIRGGNLYQIRDNAEHILRKDPSKQRALQLPVYNDDHVPKDLIKAGWPRRWAAVQRGDDGLIPGWTDSSTGWVLNEENQTYTVQKDATPVPAWLRYRHFFAMPQDWDAVAHGQPVQPKARLIGDFCGYNATIGEHPGDASFAENIDFGPFWVPDLTINFEVQIRDTKEDGELILELCEGTSWYRCRIHVPTGKAVLEEVNSQMNERVVELAQGNTPIRSSGTYRISYCNVDDRLCLWVNDSFIDFKEGALLQGEGATGNPFPTDQDLTPVGIGAQGIDATVSHLVLQRDIYYRVGIPGRNFDHLDKQLWRHMDDPQAWGEFYAKHLSQIGERTMEIGPDQYLAFGDNSPQSNDSRMWPHGEEAVPREYLVGKAFWIYWPHGVPFGNNGRGWPVTSHFEQPPMNGRPTKVADYPRYTIPFYPQFSRMKRIR